MKKLKAKALQLSATELLTREQMKNILAGSGSGTCGSGPCILYIQGSNGSWVPRNGSCNQMGGLIPNALSCYCDTGLGIVPITSNGGVSRCTN